MNKDIVLLFQNLLFFVVSDDPLWCTENIIPLGEDIYLASQTSTDFNEIYPESAGESYCCSTI